MSGESRAAIEPVQEVRVISTVSVQSAYAPWGVRAKSFLFDYLIVAAIWSVVLVAQYLILYFPTRDFYDRGHVSIGFNFPTGLAGSLFVVGYFTIYLSTAGRTPGMASPRTLLEVRDARTGALPIWQQVFVRSLPLVLEVYLGTAIKHGSLALLGLLLTLVDYVFFPLYDKRSRTLHDMLGSTVVVYESLEAPGRESATYRGARRRVLLFAGALLVVMSVVGGVVSYDHRQPNPDSALGVAMRVAKDSQLAATRAGRTLITVHDVVNGFESDANLLFMPGVGGFSVGPLGAHEVLVTLLSRGSHYACIFVSSVPGVLPTARACPPGTKFN